MKKTDVTKILRVRKLLHILFILSVIFVYVENVTTYLSLTMKKDIVEVGTTLILINKFGLEFGITISFLITATFAFLCYYSALYSLPKRKESSLSHQIFRYSFMGLTGLCFGLFSSAYNDTLGLVFGYTPLGWLDPLSRYLFSIIIVSIGVTLSISIERKLPR